MENNVKLTPVEFKTESISWEQFVDKKAESKQVPATKFKAGLEELYQGVLGEIKSAGANVFDFFKTVPNANVPSTLELNDSVAPKTAMLSRFLREYHTNSMSHTLKAGIDAGQIPEMITRGFKEVNTQDYFDIGYKRSFMETPADPDRQFVEVPTIDNNLVWSNVAEGADIDVAGAGFAYSSFGLKKGGTGASITDEAKRFRTLASMIDFTKNLRRVYEVYRSNFFYGLLATAGNAQTVFPLAASGLSGDTQIGAQQLATLNGASTQLKINVRRLIANSDEVINLPLILYIPENLRSLINATLRRTINLIPNGVESTDKILQQNIEIIPTLNSSIGGLSSGTGSQYGYLVLPNIYLRMSTLLEPQIVPWYNPKNMNSEIRMYSYFGGYVGLNAQVLKVQLL